MSRRISVSDIYCKNNISKNGQVTIFIIVGIVIVILVFWFISFASDYQEQKFEDETTEITMQRSELEPIVNYAELCIESVAKTGFFLLGSQGGYIYESQGGDKIDYGDELLGRYYVDYATYDNSVQVPYRINRDGAGTTCDSSLPNYPTLTIWPYPYDKIPVQYDPPYTAFEDPDYLTDKEYYHKDCFGKRVLFNIDESMSDLKKYMETRIGESCDFSAFSNYDVTAGDLKVEIDLNNPSKTKFIVEYPILLRNKNTASGADLREFIVDVSLNLEELYLKVNRKLEFETSDPTFDIGIAREGENFVTRVIRDVYNNDDVIIIEDDELELDGQSFKLSFARRNRYPVLEYVFGTDFSSVPLEEHYIINYEDVILERLVSIDPDEDETTTHIFLGEGIAMRELTPENSYEISFGDAVQVGHILVNITASDGEHSDYQLENKKEEFTII